MGSVLPKIDQGSLEGFAGGIIRSQTQGLELAAFRATIRVAGAENGYLKVEYSGGESWNNHLKSWQSDFEPSGVIYVPLAYIFRAQYTSTICLQLLLSGGESWYLHPPGVYDPKKDLH